MCSAELVVTEQQKKRFDCFACSNCYTKARLQISATLTENQRNFFQSEEFRLDGGRRCGVSHMRAV